MASSIQVQVLQSFNDVQFRLANSWKARLWDETLILPSWTTLRVGCCAVIPAVTSLLGKNLAFGICSGVTQPYGTETVANFIGAKFGAGDTWAYVSGELTSVDCYASVKQSGSGETLSASKIMNDGRFWTATNRSALFVQVTRGSPNYTVDVGMAHGVANGLDVTPEEFLTGMSVPFANLSTWKSGYTSSTPQTVPVDVGTYGQFNAVNWMWDDAGVEFRNCTCAVARIA